MSVLNFTIDVSPAEMKGLEANIMREFSLHMNNIFNAITPLVATKTNQIVADALQKSDAWAAINGGVLEELLKIQNPSAALYQIERSVVDTINIQRTGVTISGQTLNGTFEVSLLDDSYASVLSGGNTSYTTANGKFIPWLEWLLFFGTSTVYPKAQLIETNRGVLLVAGKNDLAIPPAYAGSPADNILTRALLPVESIIGQMIQDEISRRA